MAHFSDEYFNIGPEVYSKSADISARASILFTNENFSVGSKIYPSYGNIIGLATGISNIGLIIS